MSKQLYMIYNPTAGQRRRGRFARFIKKARASGYDVALKPTDAAGHAAILAGSNEARMADRVVVCGGDGTFNEAVNGFVSHTAHVPPMAFAPFGTANVLAHELNYPRGLEAQAREILNGAPRSVKLATANGRHFVLMVSVGIDSLAVAGVNSKLKRLVGPLAYLASGTLALRRYFKNNMRYRVSIDGAAPIDAVTVIVTRARKYGGPFVIAPDAGLETDDLHIVMFRKSGVRPFFNYAWGLLTGRMDHQPPVTIMRGRHVAISGLSPDPVQMDGDAAGTLPVEISMADATIPLVYPSPA